MGLGEAGWPRACCVRIGQPFVCGVATGSEGVPSPRSERALEMLMACVRAGSAALMSLALARGQLDPSVNDARSMP